MLRQLPLPPLPPSSSSSRNRIWIVIAVVGLLFVLLIIGSIATLPNNQSQNNANPGATATPTATSHPTATSQPSKNIAISYSYQIVQFILNQKGYLQLQILEKRFLK